MTPITVQDMETSDTERSSSPKVPDALTSSTLEGTESNPPMEETKETDVSESEKHMQQANRLVYELHQRNLQLQSEGYQIQSPLLNTADPVVQAAICQEEPQSIPLPGESNPQAVNESEPVSGSSETEEPKETDNLFPAYTDRTEPATESEQGWRQQRYKSRKWKSDRGHSTQGQGSSQTNASNPHGIDNAAKKEEKAARKEKIKNKEVDASISFFCEQADQLSQVVSQKRKPPQHHGANLVSMTAEEFMHHYRSPYGETSNGKNSWSVWHTTSIASITTSRTLSNPTNGSKQKSASDSQLCCASCPTLVCAPSEVVSCGAFAV